MSSKVSSAAADISAKETEVGGKGAEPATSPENAVEAATSGLITPARDAV